MTIGRGNEDVISLYSRYLMESSTFPLFYVIVRFSFSRNPNLLCQTLAPERPLIITKQRVTPHIFSYISIICIINMNESTVSMYMKIITTLFLIYNFFSFSLQLETMRSPNTSSDASNASRLSSSRFFRCDGFSWWTSVRPIDISATTFVLLSIKITGLFWRFFTWIRKGSEYSNHCAWCVRNSLCNVFRSFRISEIMEWYSLLFHEFNIHFKQNLVVVRVPCVIIPEQQSSGIVPEKSPKMIPELSRRKYWKSVLVPTPNFSYCAKEK